MSCDSFPNEGLLRKLSLTGFNSLFTWISVWMTSYQQWPHVVCILWIVKLACTVILTDQRLQGFIHRSSKQGRLIRLCRCTGYLSQSSLHRLRGTFSWNTNNMFVYLMVRFTGWFKSVSLYSIQPLPQVRNTVWNIEIITYGSYFCAS